MEQVDFGDLHLLADAALLDSDNTFHVNPRNGQSPFNYRFYYLPFSQSNTPTSVPTRRRSSLRFIKRSKFFWQSTTPFPTHFFSQNVLIKVLDFLQTKEDQSLPKTKTYSGSEKLLPPVRLVLRLRDKRVVLGNVTKKMNQRDDCHVGYVPNRNKRRAEEGKTVLDDRVMKRQKRISNKKENEAPSEPVLPMEFVEKIASLNGTQVKFLIQKRLYGTDVNKSNNRFSFPKTQIQDDFLKKREEAVLDERIGEKQKPRGIQVLFLDPCLREFTVCLKKWVMNGSAVYNLVGDWSKIVKSNALKREEIVQLWCFRIKGNISFALIRV